MQDLEIHTLNRLKLVLPFFCKICR